MKKLKLYLALAVLIVGLGGTFFITSNVVEAHTRTVKITVDKNGFSPSSIEVEAGHKVNLVFNRADKNNCGNVVVFPKLKIRKNLPVGKDVIVSIMPTKAGNISFSCGMGMMKGSVVVTD
ncbi:MAG TPA: cupredoxin domain-containing protein [Pyrinomonadaceae bacterium]|nr:cupredoxin domain-containing protein [Pyrinomonadaceae bacterium]